MKRTIMTTAAFAAVLFIGASAQATDNTFTGANDNTWNDTGNWSLGHIPTGDENAVIPSSKTCNVDTSAVADTVEVQTYAFLNITGSNSLTLDGSTSKVSGSGVISLAANSELAFTTNDHTISCDGTPGAISGTSSSAVITLGTDSRGLTSSITIRGALTITEDASEPTGTSFVNNGTVRADIADTLSIAVDSFSGSGTWEVTTYGTAELEFSVDSSSVSMPSGNFYVSTGKVTVDPDVEVETSGDLVTFNNGAQIVVGDGGSIAFNQ